MTILLAGNVSYFSEKELLKAFPEERLIILGNLETSSRKIRQIVFNESTNLQQVFKSYDISQMIYFSDSLNALSAMDTELQQLRKLFGALKKSTLLKFLYVTGPDTNYQNVTSRGIIMASAEELCQHYAGENQFSLKIIRSLHLYHLKNEKDSLGQLVSQLKLGKKIDFRANPAQKAYYIYSQDLLTLCYRVLDSWDSNFECLSIANNFNITYSDILEQLNLSTRGLFFVELPLDDLIVNDSLLKERYGWFPKVSILDDIGGMPQEVRQRRMIDSVSFLTQLLYYLRTQNIYVRLVEFLLLFSVSESLSYVLGQQVYFKTIDYRLFFVMTAGFIFGTNMGLAAAALATVGLVIQNVTSGASNLATLFFEPSNWIPYMVYFISAMISGYVKEKNQDELASLKSENSDLTQQIEDEHSFIDDLLTEKAELTHQILGRQDSYGKIYHFLTHLDTPYLDVFMVNLIHYLSDVFETESISVYSMEQNQLGKLQFSIRTQNNQIEQVMMDKSAIIFSQIEENGIWVNHHLREGYPTYMSVLADKGDVHYYLLIQDVPMEKLNLYHQNLFKILMGLANRSYEQLCLANGKQRENYVMKTVTVLEENNFYQKLLTVKEMDSHYFNGQVLRLSTPSLNLSPSPIERLLAPKFSMFDTLGFVNGEYYLLFNARTDSALPDWRDYLVQYGIGIKAVQSLEETIEDIQFTQVVS